MTTKHTKQQQYERMREVAQRDHLSVVGRGVRKSDGATVYAVPSRSQANRWHLVVVAYGGLVCDCTAAQFNRYCCHRAAARARMEAEASATREQRALEASLRGDELLQAVMDPSDYADLKARESEQKAERAARRERGVLVSSSAPFSIWK